MKTLLITLTLGLGLFATAPVAEAVPGQCMYSPWGGFCDTAPASDGSFNHCESALGFSNCYRACLDANGRPYPAPANLPC